MALCMPCLARMGVELMVIALFSVMSMGFLITYIIAVSNEHVNPYFPYISDTGSTPPESCVFSFVCSVGAILVLFVVYIRHQHLHQYFCKDGMRTVTFLNHFGVFLGLLCVLGMLLVGAFQDTAVLTVHFIGAFMVFGCGVAYEWVQLLASYKIYKCTLNRSRHVSKWVLVLRLILSIVGTISFLATVIIGQSISEKPDDIHFWEKDDGGYVLHVLSTANEWIMSFAFLLYFLTFHVEFVQISLEISVRARYHHQDTVEDAINERTSLK